MRNRIKTASGVVESCDQEQIQRRAFARVNNRETFFVSFAMLTLMLLVSVSDAVCQQPVARTGILPDAFTQSELLSLSNGAAVTKILPTDNQKEVAVCGVVPLHASSEMFLDSFRQNLVRRSNGAILEIGEFSQNPSVEDLDGLTIEDRDIDDLRACMVGDCKLKLSAAMISRLRKEVDWGADYKTQFSQLFKQMLVEYIRDYVARGDSALITYSDKPQPIAIAETYRELLKASSYERLFHGFASDSSHLRLIESPIVWSKIKFGLKPVITINQISIYKTVQDSPSQVLIVSKQIYANHYFESSLALTAYMSDAGTAADSYLFYENRSRLDGLEGPFGKFMRGVVKDRALASLSAILNESKTSLNARTATTTESALSVQSVNGWYLPEWSLAGMTVWLAIVFLISRLRKQPNEHP